MTPLPGAPTAAPSVLTRATWICLLLHLLVLPFAGTVTLRLVTLYLALACWLGDRVRTRDWSWARSPVFAPFTLFVLWALLSALTSVAPRYSLTKALGEPFNALVLVGLILQSRAGLREMRVACLGFAALLAGLGLLGIRQTLASLPGVLDMGAYTFGFDRRVDVGAYHLPTVLTLGVPFLVALTYGIWRRGARWVLLGALVVAALAALLTFTRAVWLAVGGALLLLGLVRDRRLAGGMLGLLLLLALLQPGRVGERVAAFFQQGQYTGRLAVWQLTMTHLLDRPVLGYGYGRQILSRAFPAEVRALQESRHDPGLWHPHNAFLSLALETGWVGLGLVLWLLAALLLALWRASRRTRDPSLRALLVAGGFATVAMLIRAQFDHVLVDDPLQLFWFVGGLALRGAALVAYEEVREGRARVLVLRTDNVGDLLCTTPALEALRGQRPETRIGLLANAYNAPVLAGCPAVDRWFIYDKFKHGRHRSRLHAWWQIVQVTWAIRRERFTAAVAARSSFSWSVARWTFMTGAPFTIGYVPADRALGRLYLNVALALDPAPKHEVLRTLALFSPLGVQGVPSKRLYIARSCAREAAAEQWLCEHGLLADRPRIGLHLSSRRPENRWPEGHYRALLRALAGQRAGVVLLRAPEDAALARRLATGLALPAVVVEAEELGEVLAVLSRLTLCVCPDGGLLHMAAALGVPTVAIFGVTDPRVWHPWGEGHQVLGGEGHADKVNPDEVWHAVGRVLVGAT
ncbi:MAG: glycosyltransferase family 9 protein [Deltaproteobacteria bacterium]|nr:glycosyltransferase family 9 protein [Deltaproteobacteria bacterium]